jgi:hypothetical protein
MDIRSWAEDSDWYFWPVADGYSDASCRALQPLCRVSPRLWQLGGRQNNSGGGPIDFTGWKPAGESFSDDDPRSTKRQLHTRALKQGETLRLPTGNWTGAVLVFD